MVGGFGTALGLAQDVQSGLFDRYRSLPMSRSAVIVGRLVADLLSNIFVAVLMIGIGMLIGFRFGGSFLESIGSPAIGILFALPAAAIFAAVGLTVRSVEAVNVIGFTLIFPITFVSSAFVPVESMPSWLQPVAEANPFSLAVNASRSLALGEDPGSSLGGVLIWRRYSRRSACRWPCGPTAAAVRRSRLTNTEGAHGGALVDLAGVPGYQKPALNFSSPWA